MMLIPTLPKNDPTPSLRDAFVYDLLAIRPDLRARALRLTRDDAHADDLVQDAVERALRCREQFVPGTNLRSWAQTIVFSVFVSGYRRRRREREAMKTLGVDPCAWTQPEPETPALPMSELPPRMRRAVDALPSGFRQVLMLVDVGEHSYRDVADHLGIPIGTVMSRLHRARRQLAAALGDESRMAA
jgi:RNA polymerase sigma-70 factor (ECF subfamily)